MAKQEKPLTQKIAREKLSRYKKALQKSTENRAAVFATAARKVALADVEDAKAAALRAAKKLSAEYAKAVQKIARVRLDAFKGKLQRHLDPTEDKNTDEMERRRTDDQIAAMRADAIRALSQNVSERMRRLLECDPVTHYGPADRARTTHSNRVHDRVHKDDGDEHADDGLDD